MIGLIFLAVLLGYGISVIIATRIAMVLMIRTAELEQPHRLKYEEDYRSFVSKRRDDAVFAGFFWPVTWVIGLSSWATTGTLNRNARLKRIRADKAAEEKETALRKQARALGLEWPEDNGMRLRHR
jgi:hypothetical protein